MSDVIPVPTNQKDPRQVRVYSPFNVYCYYGSYCEQICFQIDSNNNIISIRDCDIGYKLNSDERTCSCKSEQYIVYSIHLLLRAFDYILNDSVKEDVMLLIIGKIYYILTLIK
ncbi:unnamed protein product [Rotaria sordida]|uniref:Uncharacterized protein n=1 Tax=Rotaria sordida TaxID=392033 RepID=A0A815Z4X8_9BILA|nr:unnamed protein product [Rotaria sordida]CAF1578207.1 unnamed protein product [Rotaria sordida]